MKLELEKNDAGILTGILELALEESTPQHHGGERRVVVLRDLLQQLTSATNVLRQLTPTTSQKPDAREIAWARKRAVDARDLYTAARNAGDFKVAQELLPLVWRFEREAEDLSASADDQT